METYIIRVNGIEYEVEVEKKENGQPAASGQTVEAAQPAPKQAQQAVKPAAKASAASGTSVTCGTAGKVWKVVASEGADLKKGDTILILEAMKMEIPVVMPSDGRVAAIQVSEGDSVEAGQTVATIA